MLSSAPAQKRQPGSAGVAAFVAVGSNLDPERHIALALQALQRTVVVEASSVFYRTAPLARPGQPCFVNGVWRIRTRLPARDLKFRLLRGIEAELGRERTADRYAARTIDLDLILYGDEIIDEPGLKIPDPDIQRRSFVAVPLCQLQPELIIPGEQRPLKSLQAARTLEGLQALVHFSEQLKKRLAKRRKQ